MKRDLGELPSELRSVVPEYAAARSAFRARILRLCLTILIVVVLCLQYYDTLVSVWNWYVANREAIVPLLTGLGGMIALWVAFGQFKTARLRHEEQTHADLQRRIIESFSKAIEQLGSDKIEVRIGGVYTLERISKEGPLDYWNVMETLTAFVRERARWNEPNNETLILNHRDFQETGMPSDIQAIMTVLGRRSNEMQRLEVAMNWILDLRSVDLRGVDLHEAELGRVVLMHAHLEGANLFKANLEGSILAFSHLSGARLEGASFHGAILNSADLSNTFGVEYDQLKYTSGDPATVLPEGLERPHAWGREAAERRPGKRKQD
ncbi:Pentapeptide repeats (8 copies) [Caballeronia turbans]|nr:Pentapeptide repeats (8 copies) [Caballeronia turbans]